jgi:uncharacterized lipoprotein
MRFLMPLSLIGSIGFMSTGCAFVSQNVALKPQINVAETTRKPMIPLAIKVNDEREDRALGYRGMAYGNGAAITTDQDVAKVIEDKIVEGVRKKGYDPIAYQDNAPRSLHVDIRLINYTSTSGFLTFGIMTKATIKGIATNGAEKYEQLYRAEDEHREMVVPTAETNEDYINKTVSNVLQQLFADEKVWALLDKTAAVAMVHEP